MRLYVAYTLFYICEGRYFIPILEKYAKIVRYFYAPLGKKSIPVHKDTLKFARRCINDC